MSIEQERADAAYFNSIPNFEQEEAEIYRIEAEIRYLQDRLNELYIRTGRIEKPIMPSEPTTDSNDDMPF